AGSLDITGALEARYQQIHAQKIAQASGPRSPAALADLEQEARDASARQMTKRAEDFYTSLGMPKLPDSYWQNTQFIKPRDRDVVCHASAWDFDMKGDVRTTVRIRPNEEDVTPTSHERGHAYYCLACNDVPPLFQTAARAGFHEAIGDPLVLAMAPQHRQSIGLANAHERPGDPQRNGQMR